MTATERVSLELDDIQSGALHERPSPYVGTYLLLRIDDPAAGRELVRRLHGLVDTGRPSADPAHDAWITAAFTYQGLKALGVPQASLDSFAPEFRQGMAARAAELGDVGESGPEHWEKPLGSPDVHVALAAISPDAARLQAVVEQARRAAPRACRRRGDLAAGLLPAADGPDVLRLQGRDRPAGGRGQRPAAVEPAGAPPQAGRDHPRLPRRDGRAAADADPGRARPQRHVHRLPQAPHAGGGLPAVPAREEREPRGGGAPGRQDGRALAERRPARGLARARRSGARRRPAAPQRLPLRRRPARPQVPARRPRATRQPARRVRRRRRRRRPPAPHDPARHQLRADAARGRARGRRRRPRHHLRVRRRAHRAPVRVRQDPVAERRHLHRRPAGEGPAGRSERRHRDLHRARSGRSAAGCRTSRPSSSPAAASTASSRACARCAGWRSWSRDRPGPTGGGQRGHEPDPHRPVEGARLRPAAVRPRGARARRCSSTTCPKARWR